MGALERAANQCRMALEPGKESDKAPTVKADASNGLEIKFMTFNVEEYTHGIDTNQLYKLKDKDKEGQVAWLQEFRTQIFDRAAKVKQIIEEQAPDVLCMQEHSMALEQDILIYRKYITETIDGVSWTHDDLIQSVLPEGYAHFVARTGERPAKYTELANLVAWKTAKFEAADNGKLGKPTTESGKKTATGDGYTPRSVALVKLKPVGMDLWFAVACTHLMGGRFEDINWAADNEVGINERVNQVVTIHELLGKAPFEGRLPSIIAGDFNVMNKGFTEGHFVKDVKKYVFGDCKLYTRAQLEKDYLEVFVPFQTAVHRKLEELGYTVAYGQDDTTESMKTSRFGGCIDWIYTLGLTSKKDEQIVSGNVQSKEGASDHNAVVVTLVIPEPAAG